MKNSLLFFFLCTIVSIKMILMALPLLHNAVLPLKCLLLTDRHFIYIFTPNSYHIYMVEYVITDGRKKTDEYNSSLEKLPTIMSYVHSYIPLLAKVIFNFASVTKVTF